MEADEVLPRPPRRCPTAPPGAASAARLFVRSLLVRSLFVRSLGERRIALRGNGAHGVPRRSPACWLTRARRWLRRAQVAREMAVIQRNLEQRRCLPAAGPLF
jgi:hypothetical protein